jgi:two-component system, OmpR family, phosphate regulon response regulator PhoB
MTTSHLVLVADDEEDIVGLVTMIIERSGHEVVSVRDGAQALAALRRRRPDLVVLDISMPEVDGLEVLRRIRADEATSELPVLLLSAQAQEADVRRGFATGASAYVKKPFSPRELAKRVDELLGSST